MAIFERDDVRIHYEIHGDGFPILMLAPGGMRSSIPIWDNVPWNPITQLAPHYKVIAMDQRNAGQSTAPIRATDGWQVYTEDQLSLLDHLGIGQCHVAGMCIGGPFIMGLIEAAPERIASAVVFQTIGYHDNRDTFFQLFDGWAEEVKPAHAEVADADWEAFRNAMFGGEFLFNVSEDFVANCQTPMLVLMGTDVYHPEESSRRLAELAPNATLIETWKEPEHIDAAKAVVEEFLEAQTP